MVRAVCPGRCLQWIERSREKACTTMMVEMGNPVSTDPNKGILQTFNIGETHLGFGFTGAHNGDHRVDYVFVSINVLSSRPPDGLHVEW